LPEIPQRYNLDPESSSRHLRQAHRRPCLHCHRRAELPLPLGAEVRLDECADVAGKRPVSLHVGLVQELEDGESALTRRDPDDVAVRAAGDAAAQPDRFAGTEPDATRDAWARIEGDRRLGSLGCRQRGGDDEGAAAEESALPHDL
jgi:hypothetical protein